MISLHLLLRPSSAGTTIVPRQRVQRRQCQKQNNRRLGLQYYYRTWLKAGGMLVHQVQRTMMLLRCLTVACQVLHTLPQPAGRSTHNLGDTITARPWLTIIPSTLRKQHPTTRRAYRTRPLRRYGQPIFAAKAGAILQNAMIPYRKFARKTTRNY